MAPADDSWRTVLDRALLWGCVLWLLIQSVNTVHALLGQWGSGGAPLAGVVIAGRSALIVLCVVAAVRGLARNHRWIMPLGYGCGAITMVSAGLLSWLAEDLARSQQLMVPLDSVQAWQIFAVAVSTRLRSVLMVIAVSGPVFAAARWPAGLNADTLVEWMTPTSATIAAAALVAYLRSGSVYAEQLDAWNRDARRTAAESAAEMMARAEARRVIHDDVISALRGVAHGAPAPAVREAAGAALSALASHRDYRTLDEVLGALEGAGIALEQVERSWPLEPPPRVLDAFRGAAAEALRNVARHSGADRALITFRTEARELVLEVRDNGRGFLVADVPHGFGLSTSVVDRMRAVGGDAMVTSEVGTGTAVRLSWPLPVPPPREQLTPYASEERWRGYVPVAAAIGTNSTVLALLYPGPHPVLALLLLAGLVVGLLVAAWHFAFRPPRPVDSIAVAAFVAAATAAGLLLAGDGALLDMRGWVVGLAGSFTMLVAFDGRARDVAVPVISQIGVCVFVAWRDPTIGPLEPVGALTTPLVICGFSALFGALLRRGAHTIRQSEATRASRIEEQVWQEAQAAARTEYLATLRSEVAPFLQSIVAEGPERASRERAASLAARCRDDLHLVRPLPDQLRGIVDEVRARGVTVNFRSLSSGDSGWATELVKAVTAVLSLPEADVVTVVPGGSGDLARIAVLPALSRRSRRFLARELEHAGIPVLVQNDDVRTVVRVSPDGMTSGGDRDAVLLPV